jgi:aarF domain-containing kinase
MSGMISRCYAFRRAVLGRHAWFIVPAAGLSWRSQQQPAPPCVAPKRPPIIFSPSEHRLSLVDHVWEYILTAKRFIYLVFLFMPVLVSSPMLLVGKPLKSLSGDRWGAVWWYGLLVSRMEAAGPTFIKVGTSILQLHTSYSNCYQLAQWAASRADLFPSLLCERLGSLHSSGKPHAFIHTKAVIQSVFQRPFDHVFQSFDPHPIGTGAIAQVT